MKKLIKVLSVSILSCMMALCLVVPVSADENKNNDQSLYKIEQIGNIFYIEDHNEKYTIEFFEQKSLVKINDKHYSMDQYTNAVNTQILEGEVHSLIFYLDKLVY